MTPFHVIVIFMLLFASGVAGGAAEFDLAARRAPVDAAFRERLDKLAAKCVELQLPAQTDVTRKWIVPRDPRRQYVFLPPEFDPTQPASDAPQVVQFWHRKFREHRDAQAAALWQLAREALDAGQPSTAFRLWHEVLRENPDHAEARKALGYVAAPNAASTPRWRRPTVVPTAKVGRLAHPQWGFPAGRHWRVESDHFEITTNASEQAGLDLARELEDLHAVWQQLFFRFWSDAAALSRALDGRAAAGATGPTRTTRRHKVVLFATRGDYVAVLKPGEPLVEMTLGIYLDRRETAFFYLGDESLRATWFHEAAHQLFSETPGTAKEIGREANCWIIEGIALYLESLRRHDGWFTVGGADADRLQFARYRALTEGYAVPLERLVVLGRTALQQDKDIRRLYTVAAGLAHFLCDHERGRHRETLVDYLRLVYHGRDRQDSLARLVRESAGLDLAGLDRQYREFLEVRDDDLAFVDGRQLRNLCLGHTAVGDRVAECLAGASRLEWLDLSFTATTDAALKHLGDATNLKQLFLERTGITDESLVTIGRLTTLEELDLSHTRITDEALAKLAMLRELKALHLAGTRITEAGLMRLTGLKQLETLDVRGTGVAPAAWERLRTNWPKVKEE